MVQTIERFGTVQHIGIRASTIRSFDGAEIVIPNGDLVAKEVINWTRTDQIRRAEVLVGVAYGTKPEVVLEILLRGQRHHDAAGKILRESGDLVGEPGNVVLAHVGEHLIVHVDAGFQRPGLVG